MLGDLQGGIQRSCKRESVSVKGPIPNDDDLGFVEGALRCEKLKRVLLSVIRVLAGSVLLFLKLWDRVFHTGNLAVA